MLIKKREEIMCEAKKTCKVDRNCKFDHYRLSVGSSSGVTAKETEVEVCKNKNVRHNGRLTGHKLSDLIQSHQAMGLRFSFLKI
ncbi:hypothetical protein A3G50_00890 [Candidatus Jorgensenbacteria bacterium RIFCSPLOWO2_12_FULL_42_11]|uniref:Uncharacterized protein n=1 Tax=Candidatus Jorgensenbacteria bacterium RIFCSPLOWO2_12_FULL_42_11 TaxID=1798473 RepID=A0A1F6C4A7_9BACT|nr:MAG: hypothetical protein A3G50_00890 [Candidatus Jorgensenbacteria bacterium RIFCSPLOWO2_12_FULL_42_11]